MNHYQKMLKQKRYDERQRRKITEDGARLAVDVLNIIPAYVLRETFGFGNARMERFLLEFHRIYRAVADGIVKVETLADISSHDTGIEFNVAAGEWRNLRKGDDANGPK